MAYRSILFVDDDVMTQWTMTDVLTSAGFDVSSVCRGADALALIEQDAEFDLLLTELDLPDGFGGLQLAQHWRHRLPNRPVIFIGASGCVPLGHLGLRDIFFEKPFDAGRLLRTIVTAIDDAQRHPFARATSWPVHHVH